MTINNFSWWVPVDSIKNQVSSFTEEILYWVKQAPPQHHSGPQYHL